MGTVATVTPIAGKKSPQRVGQVLKFEGTIAMSSSYATGGDTLSAKTLGMTAIEEGVIGSFDANLLRIIPQTNGDAKIKAVVSNTGAEVANATNLSTVIAAAVINGR